MKARSVESIVRELNEAGVRYLIVGGLAVVAHGHVRFTADVDLVLDFAPGNVAAAVRALSRLGYRPRAPVSIELFADSEHRRKWATEKGMTVFSLRSEAHPATEVDLFVEPPFDFDRAFSAAARMELAPAVFAMVVGLDDLLAMKRAAGRAVDLSDAEHLTRLREERGRQP